MYAIRDKESGSLYCLTVGVEQGDESVVAELWLMGGAPWLTDSLDDARSILNGSLGIATFDCPRLEGSRVDGAEVVMVEVTVIA